MYIGQLREKGNIFFTNSSLKFLFSFLTVTLRLRFIDYLCAINDSFEFNGTFKDIYPSQLELKIGHLVNTFLGIDVEIINGKFINKIFDKRD